MSLLLNKLEAVVDAPSFIAFLEALAEDRNADGDNWQNDTIEAFLESAIAWERDTQGHPNFTHHAKQNPWRRCAGIIHAGKIYE